VDIEDRVHETGGNIFNLCHLASGGPAHASLHGGVVRGEVESVVCLGASLRPEEHYQMHHRAFGVPAETCYNAKPFSLGDSFITTFNDNDIVVRLSQ
jgi:hypothetical protein